MGSEGWGGWGCGVGGAFIAAAPSLLGHSPTCLPICETIGAIVWIGRWCDGLRNWHSLSDAAVAMIATDCHCARSSCTIPTSIRPAACHSTTHPSAAIAAVHHDCSAATHATSAKLCTLAKMAMQNVQTCSDSDFDLFLLRHGQALRIGN